MNSFIENVEKLRLTLKKKLDIFFYISLCLLGVALILLILFFCFVTDTTHQIEYLLLASLISIGLAAIIYGTTYYYFNNKYLKSFIENLDIESLKYLYEDKFKYDRKSGVSLDLFSKSRIIATPDEFSSSKGLYIAYDNINAISSDYDLNYIYDRQSKNKEDKIDRIKVSYRGKFIRFEVKKDNIAFISLMTKDFPKEILVDPRIGEKIDFEYRDFNEYFIVKSSSRNKARELLNPKVQLDLLNLVHGFKIDLSIVIIDNYIYVYLGEYDGRQNLNIYKKFDKSVFKSYYDEFYLIRLIAEALDLDSRLYQ